MHFGARLRGGVPVRPQLRSTRMVGRTMCHNPIPGEIALADSFRSLSYVAHSTLRTLRVRGGRMRASGSGRRPSRAACTIVTPFESCKRATREARQPNHSLQLGARRDVGHHGVRYISPYRFFQQMRLSSDAYPRRSNARSISFSMTN
jgi:hypothetical protein